jgi:hypothetical protein
MRRFSETKHHKRLKFLRNTKNWDPTAKSVLLTVHYQKNTQS